MSLLAVELNDAGLVLARSVGDGTAVEPPSPGYALLSGDTLLLGAEAAARARITPLYAQTRYWHQLGLERLPWVTPSVQTHADLAHAHLQRMLADVPADTREGLLFAVPPGLSREQLGLLVGIGNEAGAPVRGLVDLAVAACAAHASSPQVLHLDLQLHQAVVTVLELVRPEGALRRVRYEILPGAGLLAVQQALAEAFATLFVRRTRFDPLHEAATEQALFDALPDWLAQLAGREEIEAEIEGGGRRHVVTVSRQVIVDTLERRLADLQHLVQSSRPAGQFVELCVSATAAGVPALLDRLAALRDCRITQLPSGAAARGALEYSRAIVRPADAVALVHRLPVGTPEAPPVGNAESESIPPDLTPTHVLHAGRAYAIDARPLVLGTQVEAGVRSVQLPAGTPGLSRRHCSLAMHDGRVLVDDHSTYGTYVNDERVRTRLALKVGDRLRLGAPGVTVELIRVMPDDGTP